MALIIRDLPHALECARALATLFQAVRDTDRIDATPWQASLTADEVHKTFVFSRALHATLDDAARRSTGERGFALVEALVSAAIGLAIVGMLATFMLTAGRSATIMAQAIEQRTLAQGRLERTLQHLDTPEAGVTVTWDESAAPCRLAHVTTIDTFNRTHEVYATRGCINQP